MRLKKVMAAVAAVALCVSSVGGATTAWAVENGGGTPEEEVVSYADLDDKDSYTVDGETIVYAGYTLKFSVSNGEVTITGIQDIKGDTINVTIPETIPYEGNELPVTEIGDNAFAYCYALTTVDCSNATTIGEKAFYWCISLTEIDCSSATSIGDWAFYECTLLATVTFGSSLETIGNYAFECCTSLTEIDCSSATSIGEEAFENCKSFTTVTCSSSLKSVGYYAFSGCSAFSCVFYKGTAEDWDKISIGSGNSYFENATRYYIDGQQTDDVSETAKTGMITFSGDTVAYDGSSTYIVEMSMTASADATMVSAGFICDEGIRFTGKCSSDSFAVVGDNTLWWAAAAFSKAKAAGTVLTTFTMLITLSDDQIATLESGTDVEFYVYPTNVNGAGATDTVCINDDIKGTDVTVGPSVVVFTVTAPSTTWSLAETTAIPDTTLTYPVTISRAIDSNGLEGIIYFPEETAALIGTPEVFAGDVYDFDNIVSYSQNNILCFAFEGTSVANTSNTTLLNLSISLPDESTVIAIAYDYDMTIHYNDYGAFYDFPVEWSEENESYSYLNENDVDVFDTVTLEDGYIRVYVDEDAVDAYAEAQQTTTTEEYTTTTAKTTTMTTTNTTTTTEKTTTATEVTTTTMATAVDIEEVTTTGETESTLVTSTSIVEPEELIIDENSLGDIDGDGAVTAIDAHRCLVAYASEQVGQDTGLTDAQKALADVDGDGAVTAIDAHYMLVYYASQQVYDNVTWNDILS